MSWSRSEASIDKFVVSNATKSEACDQGDGKSLVAHECRLGEKVPQQTEKKLTGVFPSDN